MVLQGSFDKTGEQESPSYTHPDAAEILDKTREILCETDLGAQLEKLIDQRKIHVHILNSAETERFVPDAGNIFIGAHSVFAPNYVRLALNLAGALREVTHLLVGYDRPDKHTDPVDFAALNFAKELDIIIIMCKIADELKEKQDMPESLDVLAEMGLIDLYKAYRSEATSEELLELLVPEDFGQNDKA